MRRLITAMFVFFLAIGCTDSTTDSPAEPISQPPPSLPEISLGPGIGGSQIRTDGLSYILSCEEGTISLDLYVSSEGLVTKQVGTRRRGDTGTDLLTCSLSEGSQAINADGKRVRGLARAGTWVCEGVGVNFTMSGHFASKPVEGGIEHNLLKTAPLEWGLSENTPCLFSVD